MMVILFASRVILQKSNFTAVKGELEFIPDSLKPAVAQEVIDAGAPYLVPTKYGGTLMD